jgi:hypothetical protein
VTSKCPFTGGRATRSGLKNGNIQVARKHAVIMQARQLKISFHLREASVRTALPFSRSPGPIQLDLQDFLRSVGEIADPVINFDDHSLRQCRVALTPLTRPRLDK